MLSLRTLFQLVLIVAAFSSCAFAQQAPSLQTSGTVKGVTVDFLGARVPNVTVAFDGTHGNRVAVSNTDGEYEIQLPAGQYRVTVAKFGIFYPYERKKLRVTAAKPKTFDVVLKYDTKKHPLIVSNATRRTNRWTRAESAGFSSTTCP
jgi:uncharacterized membrane protein